MDKYENYGFRLIIDETTTQKHYDDIKGVICDICFHIENKIEKMKISSLIIAFPLQKDNAHVTINVHNNQIRFAVFKEGKLHNSFPINSFNLFDFENASDIYTRRCENLIEMFAKEKLAQNQLAKNDIITAWKQLLLKEKIDALVPETKESEMYAKAFYRQVQSLSRDVDKISFNTGFSKEEISAVKSYVFNQKPDFIIAHSWQRLVGDKEKILPHDILMLKNKLRELIFLKKDFSKTEAINNADAMYDYRWESKKHYENLQKQEKLFESKENIEHMTNIYER